MLLPIVKLKMNRISTVQECDAKVVKKQLMLTT